MSSLITTKLRCHHQYSYVMNTSCFRNAAMAVVVVSVLLLVAIDSADPRDQGQDQGQVHQSLLDKRGFRNGAGERFSHGFGKRFRRHHRYIICRYYGSKGEHVMII